MKFKIKKRETPLGKNPDTSQETSLDVFDLKIQLCRKPYLSRMKIHISPNGEIKLTASKRMPLKDILDFLNQSKSWIQKRKKETDLLKQKYPPKRYKQGESFLFLGHEHRLKFYPSNKKEFRIQSKKRELQCLIPHSKWNTSYQSQPQPHIKIDLLDFYKTYGKSVLSQSLRFYSHVMNLNAAYVSYRSQKTRWGSCSERGGISLNWRLVAAPIFVMNYIVVHELAHLKYLDHSQRFWNLVEKFYPHYKQGRKWLREHQFELDFLSPQSELHKEKPDDFSPSFSRVALSL